VDIEDLRNIGKELFFEIGKMRLKPFASKALGKGAGGDQTYPIDKQAEDIIINSLERLREPFRIISEESGTKQIMIDGRRVLIDPVDGSRNAINGVPFYCTSIAVAEGDTIGSILTAYIINLISGDEFWARKGKGAFFNGEKISAQQDDILYLVAYEAQQSARDIPKIMDLLGQARRTRCLGATALDLAYVAYGAVSVFVCPAPSRSFDFAGGWLMVNEAGGIFTDTDGNSIADLSTGLDRTTPLLAAGNKTLHERALRLLGKKR
jgi:myo-inositol-1(or 4)-monophosphatase